MDIFKRSPTPRQVRRTSSDKSGLSGSLPSDIEVKIPKKKWRRWKKVLVSVLAVIVIAGGGAIGGYLYLKATPLKGETSGRINMLFLGVDDAAQLSDTIILVSIDTRNEDQPKAAIVSIPRDLFVDIPQFGGAKINAAYAYGQRNDYPGGGPALSKETLEQAFGLHMHYFATLDFTGFTELIDTVGGVDVEVKQDINDPFFPSPDYSGYEPFTIEAGTHRMNGNLALRYARSRYTTNDFDRAARQQQVILALRSKMLSKDTLFDRAKIMSLSTTLKEHLRTDLSRRQMFKLGLILRNLDEQNITRHVIDTSNFLNGDGSALYPKSGDFTEISEFIEQIFNQIGNTLPEAQI